MPKGPKSRVPSYGSASRSRHERATARATQESRRVPGGLSLQRTAASRALRSCERLSWHDCIRVRAKCHGARSRRRSGMHISFLSAGRGAREERSCRWWQGSFPSQCQERREGRCRLPPEGRTARGAAATAGGARRPASTAPSTYVRRPARGCDPQRHRSRTTATA
jgi:hypothetical protein